MMLLDKPAASTGNFVRRIETAVSAIPGIIVGNPLIFALLVFSAVIRAYGVFWGVTVFPLDISIYHPDEPKVIRGAFNFPSDILERTDLRYPTAQHYIIGILFWPLAKLAGVAGISGYDAVYMSARAISVAMGTLTVGFTYLAGRKIFNHHVGLLSAAILSVAPMHVANSSWATLDVPSSLWLIVFCWLLVRSNSCLQHWGWLGFTLGLLVGTKYTGGMAVVVLLAAVAAELRQSSSWGYTVRELAANRRLWAIGGIAAAVFFASTPSILINPNDFFESIAFLRAQLANASQPLWQTSVWTQQFHKFASALGIPIVIAGGIGIAGCFVLASGRKLRPFALMLLVFCCYFGGALIPRYIILVAPLCALLAGYALAIPWISPPPPPIRTVGQHVLLASLCTLVIGSSVIGYTGVQTFRTLAARYPDSRMIAERYIAEHLTDGTTIGFAYSSEDDPYPNHSWRYPQVDLDRLVATDFLKSPEYIVTSYYSANKIKAILKSGILNEDDEGDVDYLGYLLSTPSPGVFKFMDDLYFSDDSPYRLIKEFRTLNSYYPSLEFPSPIIEIFHMEDYEGYQEAPESKIKTLIDVTEAGDPVIRSDYDIYLSENRLVYIKGPCSRDDIDAKFFLHLIPVDESDLPEHREQYGFDNLDFNFRSYGWLIGERCVAVRELPDYNISIIRSGQYIPSEGRIWQAEFPFTE